MKYLDWNEGKNRWLKSERGISFEEVVLAIVRGGLLDVLEHPDPQRYPGQKVLVVVIERYVYLVPFVETEDVAFLKTIIPSRKMTRKYLGGEDDEAG